MEEVNLAIRITEQVIEIQSGSKLLFLWNFKDAGILPGLTIDNILSAIGGLIRSKIYDIQK